MKKLILILTSLICVLIFNSCEDVLDLKPKREISDEAVWNDPNLIRVYLNGIYDQLGLGGLGQANLSEVTDNASSIPVDLTQENVQSTINARDQGIFTHTRGDILQYNWNRTYEFIKRTNIFLKNIDDSAIEDPNKRKEMKGEALFLRAYFYHNLLRTRGGVPIITKVFGLHDSTEVPRSSFAETVNFIVQEADNASKLLPLEREDKGHASKGAALALKSRVLLYAASDLYNKNPSGMSETGYVKDMNRNNMWRDAKKAAKEVIDLGIYSLYKPNPEPGDSVAKNYYELYRTYNNDQAILARYWSNKGRDFMTTRAVGMNQYHGPNGFHQWGGTTPTQQLIDAYEMKDGSDFSWDNAEEAAHPYKNRDPRFYASILYDGASWFERPSGVAKYDGDNVIQTFTELELPDGSTVPGLDTRQSPEESWNATYSGYYMRKFLDETQPPPNAQTSVWMYFNYAEILLNYAEASINLGEYDDARQAMNKIRRRVNMPTYGSSFNGPALMDEYRNERRIELAFEEQRYFDVRRWMIAPKVMDQDAKGIDIHVEGKDRADRSTYTNYNYKVITYQERHWDDKMYFVPIPKDEMNRVDKLIQNPGW